MKYFSPSSILIAAAAINMTGCNSEANFSGAPKRSYDQVANQVFRFTSSKIIPAAVTISDGGRYTSFDVVQAEKSPYQVLQRQIKRQAYSEAFAQGHAARFSQEEFQLSEAGMLDFMVVVDDSRSMNDEQLMVGQGLSSLISQFKDTNWQIAVISMSNPCVDSSNLIKKSDANAEQKFANAIQKPLDRQATEQGFPMAIKSLKGECNGATRPWVRQGSSIGVLFLSDEDNCGSDSGEQQRCKNLEGKNSDEMVAFLRSIRSPEDARLYAIVDKDGSCPDAGGKGSMYVEALLKTGGTAGSICHDFTSGNGYGAYLNGVSTDVSRIIKRQFTLHASPDMAQFVVLVDGKQTTGGVVSVKGNVVTIDPSAFKDGSKITFSYTHDAIPMFESVPLKASPNLETLKVLVNGAPLNLGSDYSYDPAARVIRFAKMPSEDARVSISYLENKELLKNFTVNLAGVRPDTLKVLVNGLAANSDAFSYDNDGVDFYTAPTDGALVSISWKTEESKITNYAASISDARHPVSWSAKDKNSGEVVPAQWDGKTIIFSADQVIAGRTVAVTVDFGEKSQLRTVDLPAERIDDDVTILADGKAGICDAILRSDQPRPGAPPVSVQSDGATGSDHLEENQGWKKRYKGKQISLQCVSGADYAVLQINYKQEVNRTGDFKVSLPTGTDPDASTLGWKVYVDGKVTRDFKRIGPEITLEADLLPPESKIDVEVITYSQLVK